MKLPIYQIDAFASRLFAGNPAAVVIVREWPPDKTLQAIAAENNLSETAFALPEGDAFPLRWFTPLLEIDLCGHATLASAHVLFEHGYVQEDEVSFQTRSGLLTVRRKDPLLSMDFPARPPVPAPCTDDLVEALGVRPCEVHAASRDLLVLLDSEAQVADLEPRFERLAAIETLALIVTAPGAEADFVSRFFAPRAGIPEDPATGSAHCTLIPFWSKRLNKRNLHALQLSRRGGEFFCEDRGSRVTISGRTIPYMRGEIVIMGDT